MNAEREKIRSKIFMMDRGIYDRCIFTYTLSKLGEIDSREAEATIQYLTIPRITKLIDGVFLFVSTPNLSIEREYKDRLSKKAGRVLLIASLACVDWVILYDKESPYEMLKILRPHVFAASNFDTLSEQQKSEVEPYIIFQVIPKSIGYSTSMIINK